MLQDMGPACMLVRHGASLPPTWAEDEGG